MARDAVDGDAEAPLPRDRADDPEPRTLALHDGALLDVQLDVRGGRREAVAHEHAVEQPARAAQRRGERLAVVADQGRDLVERRQPGVDGAAETPERKTASLFARPRDDFDRALHELAGLRDAPERFEPADDAVRAVVRAAVAHRVEMRAALHGRVLVARHRLRRGGEPRDDVADADLH